MKQSILLVEDDSSLAEATLLNLQRLGAEVKHCSDGNQAWDILQKEHFDLVILDIMLPGKCGNDLCRDLRTRKPQQQIMILSAMDSELDLVIGLELGANDYVVKPFSIRELTARVKAQLRQAIAIQKPDKTSCLHLGELKLDIDCHQVQLGQKELKLTSKEFSLLYFLAQHQGKVFNREQLLSHVWGYKFNGYENTVNTHINRLRKKLLPFDYVHTIWGVGYTLQVDR